VTPFAFLLDRLLTTDGGMTIELYITAKDYLYDHITLYFFVPFIFTILMILRPAAQYTYAFYISTSEQRFLQMFVYVLAFLGYFVYMESASFIDLKDMVLFLAMAYLVPY
jgi:uncharacterized membrane protein